MNLRESRCFLGVWLWLAASGAVHGLLLPQSAQEVKEFLSQVRYLITSEEKKAFRALPDSEKPRFIQEFWARRDPDPSTTANELKDIYFGRVDAANRLFIGEGSPGWLTDRGRVYVLYGPPNERSSPSPIRAGSGRGSTTDLCREVWSYRGYQVVFEDKGCRGGFRLVTVDLGPLYDLSLSKDTAQKPILPQQEKSLYDFDLALKHKEPAEGKFEGLVELAIPYNSIWFVVEGGKYVASYDVRLELRDSRNVLRWEHTSRHDLSLTPEELRQNQQNKYRLAILMTIDKDVAALQAGKNKLLVELKNTKVNEVARKTAEFSLGAELQTPEKKS